MNDDPHSDLDDLEARLRAWRPAEMPRELQARLRAARPAPRWRGEWTRRTAVGALAGALALALGIVLAGRFAPSPDARDASPAGAAPAEPRAAFPMAGAEDKRVFGESLTMNIYTGVQPDMMLAAWHVDASEPGAGIMSPGHEGARLWDYSGPIRTR